MIKINLAQRKQSASVEGGAGADGTKGLTSFTRVKVNFEGLNELPIKKLAVCVVIGFAAHYMLEDFKQKELATREAEISKLTAERANLQKEVDKTKAYEGLRKSLEGDETMIVTKINTIKKLMADRGNASKLLLSLSSAIPNEVWLTSFHLKDWEIQIFGKATDFNKVSDFIKNLNESTYFKDVNPKKTILEKDDDIQMEVAGFELTALKR